MRDAEPSAQLAHAQETKKMNPTLPHLQLSDVSEPVKRGWYIPAVNWKMLPEIHGNSLSCTSQNEQKRPLTGGTP